MSTERKVSIVIAAKDLATNVLGRLRADVVSFAASFASGAAIYDAAKASVRAFYDAVADGVRASIEAERSNAQLARALASVGVSGTSALDATNQWVKALARSNNVSTASVRTTATMMASIGRLSGDTLQRATRAALDFASAYGKDLKDAAIGVAKAASGNMDALRENGIVIDQTIPKAQRFAEVLRVIEQTAGGAAKTQAGTTAGAIEGLTVSIGNFKRALADTVVGVDGKGYFSGLAAAINAAADAMDNANRSAASPDGVMAIFRGFASQTNARPFGGFAASGPLNALFGDSGLTSSAKQWSLELDRIKSSIGYIYALAENAGTPQAAVAGQIERIALRAKTLYGADAARAIDETIHSLGGLAIQYENLAIAAAEKQNATNEAQARAAALAAEKERQDALNKSIEEELKLFKERPEFGTDWVAVANAADAARRSRDQARFGTVPTWDEYMAAHPELVPSDPLAWEKPNVPLPGAEVGSALRAALAVQKEMLDGWNKTDAVVGDITSAIVGGLASGIMGILQGTMTLGNALKNIFRSVLQVVIDILVRLAAAQLIKGILGATLGGPAGAISGGAAGIPIGPSTNAIGRVGDVGAGSGLSPAAAAMAVKSAPGPTVTANVVTIATRRAAREIVRLNNEYAARRGGVVIASEVSR